MADIQLADLQAPIEKIIDRDLPGHDQTRELKKLAEQFGTTYTTVFRIYVVITELRWDSRSRA